jgi:hypothetical protein
VTRDSDVARLSRAVVRTFHLIVTVLLGRHSNRRISGFFLKKKKKFRILLIYKWAMPDEYEHSGDFWVAVVSLSSFKESIATSVCETKFTLYNGQLVNRSLNDASLRSRSDTKQRSTDELRLVSA